VEERQFIFNTYAK
jgi:hypothetical protein